ncbi:MAG TPA: hypothetical protein VGE29_06130 [Prosthecobacter sp.]
MRLPHLLIAACAALTLASCQGGGRVDASYPTVSELDRLDSQWGLQPRRSRGAPKRTYQYSAPTRETVNTPAPGSTGPTPNLDPAAGAR